MGIKMQQYRYMNKRQRIVHRVKLILEEQQPLTIDQIVLRLADDKYHWMPHNTNQLAQLVRGHFNVKQIRLCSDTGEQYEYSLKEE